jgi:hypothetical protein
VSAAKPDEIVNIHNCQIMVLGEAFELRASSHRAIIVDHFRQNAGRIEPGRSRQVDRGFSVAGAAQHAALERS